ncbi:MAG TPA: bifunctional UDP-sugar hydrolase/5'-nucleotidase [Elusimicrobiales bacterium]|nr:bifunctional UDP-sugar hydrolase/5'-nucleotidase [Elusimicrobiales bacterium]
MKKIFLALTLLSVFSGLHAAAATIAVYHTSDAHGWYSARPAQWDKQNSTRSIGGFAALSALLKKETTPYLLLDSGDMFQGTPEGILTKGMASITLMNQLGYAAAVPGNHDYDYAEPNLKVMISSAAFPFLGANVYYKEGGANADYLKPYILIEKGGKKIAVLGLAGAHTAASTLPANVKHLDFRDEAAETAHWLPEVKKQNPDAIIALAHIGMDNDLALKMLDVSSRTFDAAQPGTTLAVGRAAPGIDLLLGGHNHTGLLTGYHDPVSGAWLGESRYGLSYVTRAELNFDDATGKLTGIKMSLLPLWVDETGEDAAVRKTIAGFNAAVDREMGAVVGTAAGDLAFSPDRLDSAIGNWLADLTRTAAGTDLGFQNSDSIRAEIKKGPVSLRALYQAMPFDNTIITMRLTGAQLQRLMADNLSEGGTAMQLSGMAVEFSAPAGKPVEIRLSRNGREIKPEDEFTAATNNYLAYGGIGGAAFTGGKEVKDTLIPVRDTMLKDFAAGPVTPPATGRIKRLQ